LVDHHHPAIRGVVAQPVDADALMDSDMKDRLHAHPVSNPGADSQANTWLDALAHMADTHMEKHNVPGPASPVEEVVLEQVRIYLAQHGVHTAGGKERRMMKHKIAACDSDSPVMQEGNEVVVVVVVEEQRIERLSSE
jgi:hypothetical protein